MPQELIIIFLLFFAILAFGWFYLQRAKARTDTMVTKTEPPAATTPAATTPAAHDDEPPTA